ncbi:MAG: hypothetical protein ACOYNL_08730 [Rickettsiales bacterium]
MSDSTPVRPTSVSIPGIGESMARPKVLRRPAQFSKTYIPSRLPTPIAPNLAAPDPAPVAPIQRLWQDDGRFAITLFIIVVLVNVAVTSWLSTMEHLTITMPSATSTISGTDESPDDTTVHILNESSDTESDQ